MVYTTKQHYDGGVNRSMEPLYLKNYTMEKATWQVEILPEIFFCLIHMPPQANSFSFLKCCGSLNFKDGSLCNQTDKKYFRNFRYQVVISEAIVIPTPHPTLVNFSALP